MLNLTLYSEPDLVSEALRLHAFVGCCCGFASAAFHVCESWPTATYSKLLALDYTMAYVATVSHSCLIVAYEMREQQTYLIALILVPLLLLGAHGTRFFLVMQGQSNTTDSAIVIALTLFMPFLFAVPFLLRAALFPNPLTPILIRWLLAFAGATGSWILQIPERFFPPGTFDYFGSSHNVMHVLVLVVWQQLLLEPRGAERQGRGRRRDTARAAAAHNRDHQSRREAVGILVLAGGRLGARLLDREHRAAPACQRRNDAGIP